MVGTDIVNPLLDAVKSGTVGDIIDNDCDGSISDVAGMRVLNLYWPAVSQSWNLMVFYDRKMFWAIKSMPMVGRYLKKLLRDHHRRYHK